MVRKSLCNHLTTKRFLGKIFYLQAPNYLELTLQIILNMWQTIWRVQLWIFVLWFWRKNTVIFVNSPQNPTLYLQSTQVTLHCSNRFIFWDKIVKFLGGNGQVFISKKQKDSAVKSIPFVLKSYGNMSLLDNQYELPWLESRNATILPRSVF